MPADAGLTPPGSSTYASNTLHVGDGTWDTGRDTFLLPNLMGLNFETMQYNGMGNRFRDMPGYHRMICAHGVIGTIVFLGLVPLSVFLIRYYSRWNPFWAFKLHVWCQVLTLLLSTVVFVIGWFAVGPKRSLSNPHHGIGLAIYVLVIFQVLWGWLVHKMERSRKRYHVPLKLVLHRWIGRILALLGIIQIPLGLTLYGSPKVLFILFAIAIFSIFVAFFVLSYLYDTEGYPGGSEYDSRHSYISGSPSRGRSHAYDDSRASYMDEKYSDEASHQGGWKKKLLGLGALGGAAVLAKKFFDRKRNRDDDTESGRYSRYSRAHTRSDSMTEETMSRMEDGRPEPSHRTPLNRPPSRPPSRPQSPGSSYYYNSTYLTNDDGPSHAGQKAFFGAGALAALKNMFTGRRGKAAEQRRVEEMRRQDLEDERIARANSKRRPGRDVSYTETDLTSDVTRPQHRPSYGESGVSGNPDAPGTYDGPHSEIPPAPPTHHEMPSEMTGPDATELAAGAATGSALGVPSSRRRQRSTSRQRHENTDSPPTSVKLKVHNDGRHVTLRRLTEEEAAANREAKRRERRSSRRRNGSVSSLSGNEGSNDRWRRVEELERQQQEQIQREQEAAAAAAAANSTAPTGSVPPSSYMPPHSSYIPPPPGPPPPSQPQHQYRPPSTMPYGSGSIGSPGTFTGTEASGDYANNRRRRRAERARARQERQNHGVEFT